MPPAALRILCLGQLSVLRDGAALAPGAIQPRRLALLGFLAAAGDRAVTRDKIAGLLWPDSDDERSRRSLAQALYSLRRDLGHEDAILGVSDLRLNPEFIGSDLQEFDVSRAEGRLERAAELYVGPFLDGFQLPGLGDFDRWLETERASIAERHLAVLERLAKDADQRADTGAAVRWWRRALGQDPHSARLTVQLMRALVRGSDRAAAIRQAEIYMTLMQQDLEIDPDPAVLRELADIRNTTDREERTSGAVFVHAPSPPPVPTVSSTPPSSADQPAARPTPRARRPIPMWVVLVAVGAVSIGGAVKFWTPRAVEPAPTTARVLVVPPDNLTGDSSYALIGPMTAEWITQRLMQTGLVDVIDSRTMLDVATLGTSENAIREFALAAGVEMLVRGSVTRDGDSLRFALQVTDANTGKLRQSIDGVAAPTARPTAALELLGQRATGAIASLSDTRLHNVSANTSRPPTWEAYREFLLGMRDFGTDYESAIPHFRRAIALDTAYAQARLWVGIASANLRRYPEADSIFRSLAAISERLAPYDRATLDYFQSGFVNGDWEGSYNGARRMVELAPGAGHALYALGTTASFTHRANEAIMTLKRIDLQRGWGKEWALRALNLIARAEHVLGKHADELETGRLMRSTDEAAGWARIPEIRALAALRRLTELEQRVEAAMTLPADPNTWEPFGHADMLLTAARELRAHGDSATAARYLQRALTWLAGRPAAERETPEARRDRARLLYATGRWEDARGAYAALMRADSATLEHIAGVALAAAHLGDSAIAATTLARLESDRRPWRFGAPSLWAARIAAALGQRDAAVSLVRRGRSEGFARTYLLHSDPDFLSLREFAPLREALRPRD